jgi:hypothetical protein
VPANVLVSSDGIPAGSPVGESAECETPHTKTKLTIRNASLIRIFDRL